MAVGTDRPQTARAPRPCLALRWPLRWCGLPTVARVAVLMVAGALPVSAIPLFVMGLLPMTDAAVFLVIPVALVAVGMMLGGSPEAVWAARGAGAGLVGVLAYDAVRMPLVWAGIWPDFIPRLGGWIVGAPGEDVVVGYAWRYVGDGAGIGLSYFVCCAVLLALRPALVTAHPVALSVGYGVAVWSGLMGTVLLPDGQHLLFRITAATVVLSLVGHLVYGSVLGVFLRQAVRAGRR